MPATAAAWPARAARALGETIKTPSFLFCVCVCARGAPHAAPSVPRGFPSRAGRGETRKETR